MRASPACSQPLGGREHLRLQHTILLLLLRPSLVLGVAFKADAWGRQEGRKASPPGIRCSNVPKHFISCTVRTTSVPTVLRAVFAVLFI